MMMQYTLLLIILLIILIVIVLKKITLNIEMRKYFDGANNINFQLQGLRYGLGDNKDKKDKNSFFGEKLDIEKQTNIIKYSQTTSILFGTENDNYLPIGHVVTKVNKKPKGFSKLIKTKL